MCPRAVEDLRTARFEESKRHQDAFFEVCNSKIINIRLILIIVFVSV